MKSNKTRLQKLKARLRAANKLFDKLSNQYDKLGARLEDVEDECGDLEDQISDLSVTPKEHFKEAKQYVGLAKNHMKTLSPKERATVLKLLSK